MQRITYDTNVMLRYKPNVFPSEYMMSAVVIQELTAGASDGAEVRTYDTTRQAFDRRGRLLVPNGEDWWMAGKVLNSLYRGIKSRSAGRPTAISKDEQQRILRDVLIARTAKRANVAVVTENVRDFKKIQRFCDVKVIPSTEYF